jgi:hypothetical protein
MAGHSETRDAARNKAQNYFAASEQRDTAIKQEIARERAAGDAKMAKLKALRLAKEAADKEAADKLAAEKPAPKAKKPRVRNKTRPLQS